MQNIELKLQKPYQRDAETVTPYKVEFEATFDDVMEALNFMREINALIIEFNMPPETTLDQISRNFIARENRKDA